MELQENFDRVFSDIPDDQAANRNKITFSIMIEDIQPLYYTPSIEEFHVGFEFEARLPSFPHYLLDWSTYDDFSSEFHANDDDDCAQMLQYSLNNGNVRVKYLDHEDIVECGWQIHEQHSPPNSIFQIPFKDPRRVHERAVLITATFDWILIEERSERPHTESAIRFSGTIRNKSELKRLMKQLGIG